MIGYRKLRIAASAADAPQNVFLYVLQTPLLDGGQKALANLPLGVVLTEEGDNPMTDHLDAFAGKTVHVYCDDELLMDRYRQALLLANAHKLILTNSREMEIIDARP